jgi:serine/threonine protein kinase
MTSYNEKADMFSLGVIACEAATGALPSQLQLCEAGTATVAAAEAARRRWAGLSEDLRRLITRLVSEVDLPSRFVLFSLLFLFENAQDPSKRPTAAEVVAQAESCGAMKDEVLLQLKQRAETAESALAAKEQENEQLRRSNELLQKKSMEKDKRIAELEAQIAKVTHLSVARDLPPGMLALLLPPQIPFALFAQPSHF